jgi:UDP-N-acetylmuramoyl-L-alanyl-D-glutamate--2,6-diaminopimelate ligase
MTGVSLQSVAEAVRVVLPGTSLGDGDGTVAIHDVVQSTDAVPAGALFCCIEGATADGHDFAPAAVAGGAVAVLAQRDLPGLGVPVIVTADTRLAMAHAAAHVWGNPSEAMSVVGVTGTNGKTTVTHLLASILDAAGMPAEVLGTLSGARTTPAAPDLQRWLAEVRSRGARAVAMEVSSHGLAQHRVGATRFAVGVFTNLGRDHLDYHHTVEEYFEAKSMLFEPQRCVAGVVNRDDTHGRLLLQRAAVPMVDFSLKEVTDLQLTGSGSTFSWRGQPLMVPIPGRFNVSNALAAATAALALGVDLGDIAAGLEKLPPVPGRFESVDAGQGFAAIVDFAHTPDGLDQALSAARELTNGRVIVVFGCGGDRDTDKRPEMGSIAARLADEVVVTSDNPRSEDPEAIVDDILAGIPAETLTIREPNRRMAIRLALSRAQNGDVVMVAGKGHERTQTIGDEVLHFDDVEEVKAGLADLA